jgi:hypothetical protein
MFFCHITAILLSKDCSKAIIKKSLNLAAKGYKVIKKPVKIDPLSHMVRGGHLSGEIYLYSLSLVS